MNQNDQCAIIPGKIATFTKSSPCIHRWLIGKPLESAPDRLGSVCKKCQATRTFPAMGSYVTFAERFMVEVMEARYANV